MHFLTLTDHRNGMPVYVNMSQVIALVPDPDDAENSTRLKVTDQFPLHVTESADEILAMMGEGHNIVAPAAPRSVDGVAVYVIQAEDGDIIDVTTSREWAEWQTRNSPNNPIRAMHEDTLWEGPEDRAEWGEF